MQSATFDSKRSRRRSSIVAAVLLVLLAAAGLLLFLLRPELPIGWLPFLIILLCPLMHMFMHRRHRRYGGHGGHGNSAAAGDEQVQRSRQF